MERRGRKPVWLWIHLLSLDAPLVAVVWQDLLARCYPSVLRPQGRLVLGLTVWAIYIADRLLDGSHFYSVYRRRMSWLLVAIAGVDLCIAIRWLGPGVLENGALVLIASAAYLFAFAGSRQRQVVWKKSSAAALFAAGVFVIELTWTPHPVTALFWPAVAFALLCKGNLVLIEHWERRWSTAIVWTGLLLFALVCAMAGRSAWYFAIALSSMALAALAFAGTRLTSDARRVLADVVLMAPLLMR